MNTYGVHTKVYPSYLSVGALCLVAYLCRRCGGGLYNWARNDAAYRPRLEDVSRGIRDNNDVPIIAPELVTGLFLKRGYMSGSVTRLEKYRQCPFKFYAQYGLKLEPRKVRSFGAPEIGTFLHANLERLGTQLLSEHKQWRDLRRNGATRIMCSRSNGYIRRKPL